jgi:hypothetical protein
VKRGGAFAIAAAALLAAPSISHHPVTASCAAPTVTFKPAKVVRGGVVTITGHYFGSDCLDTGTLPQGVGPLGDPLTGLVIVIDQGQREFVVAAGSAGDDYAFHVDIVVPIELEPGPASLAVLGAGDARLATDLLLTISSAAAIGANEATVATFGSATTDPQPVGSVPPLLLPTDIPDDHVATVPPLSTTPTENVGLQIDHRRAISVAIVVVLGTGLAWFAIRSVWRRRSR